MINSNYSIRRAQLIDSKRIWQIRNDDRNRIFMRHSEKIFFADHQLWFTRYLKGAQGYFFVLLSGKRLVGYVRFDKRGKKELEISIALDSQVRGKGKGSFLLREVLKKFEPELKKYKITAEVKKDNPASQKLFVRNNFALIKINRDYRIYRYYYPQAIIIVSNHDWGISALSIASPYKVIFINKKSDLNFKKIVATNPRYIFFSHWSWLIPKEIYQRYECIVFHMTDLPYGRGGTPLQNLILRDHNKTKISALRVVAELDAGSIYLKKSLSLHGSAQEIYQRAAKIIAKMITEIIRRQPQPIPQKGTVTIFQRRQPAESMVPNHISLVQLYDFIRMLDAEGYPHAFLTVGKWQLEFSNVKYYKNYLKANIKIYEK